MATRSLLILMAMVFVAQQVWPDRVLALFGLWPDVGPILVGRSAGVPILAEFHVWQFLTHGFLHGGVAHLLLNGLALLMFGAALERVWGAGRFLVFFLLCVIGGGLIQWWWIGIPQGNEVSVTLGASGGVFGVLVAFAMMFPRERLLLLFPPIPMPAWLLVSLFAIISTVLGLTGVAEGIAHFAHLGGMLAGLLLYLIVARHWRPQRFVQFVERQ